MKYKVTSKTVFCEHRGCPVAGYDHTIFDCLECGNRSMTRDDTETYTQEEYLNLLERGNVYITKVEVI